ncbi:microtubule-associated protein 9 isoform X11 [Monodelphis domestica]|uniref:microtubule-associated protein 9 isoform X11 n=1 Tax=Monodelphis domestica TaxID=13616 RepID=UPI0024E1B2B8|nr:microtubule-associated protein 9 isoform X11 [Monodelphis domestica]XP_056658788.1 microtubule-associated protein 9 isoform X11 [Monodelphis domestica]
MSDEVSSSILAYTKSPKITKRTTFQDELERAVSARSSRQQSEDYSDDFDSDDDDDDAENISNFEKDTNVKIPLPRLRGILRKTGHAGDKDVLEEEDNSVFAKTQFSHSAPSSLTRLGGKILEIQQRTLSESPNSEGPWLTSPRTSLVIPHQRPASENLGDYLFPVSAERSSKIDQEQIVDENHNCMKSGDSNKCSSIEEQMVSNTLEKTEQSQLTIEELEKNMKSKLIVDEERKSTTSNVIHKKKNEDKNLKKKTSKRMKINRKKTQPTTTSSQYLGTLKILDQKPSQKHNLELDKADSIRAAVYQDWLVKKNLCFQELQRVKKNEAENLKIQNEQKGVKKEEASASFEAWKAMKEKEARKMAAKKKLEAKKLKKIEEENAEKKGEAQKAFEKWKEKKLEYLKEKNKKEKEFERAKKKKEEEYFAEKIKDNLSAVERWHEQKDFLIRQKMKEKTNERKRQEIKKVQKEDKDRLAVNEYEKWLEKKERKAKIERKQRKHHVLYTSESIPPWSPPSKLTPAKNY